MPNPFLRFMIVLGLLVAPACGSEGTSTPFTPSAPRTMTVAGPTAFTTRGQTGQFSATLRLSNGLEQDRTQTATWTSSRPNIAAVSTSGLVTALASGTADITASFDGVTGFRRVAVSIPCELNHTAAVLFTNGTPTTFTVVFDGADLANVDPNVTTNPFDVTAGVQHMYDFLVTNTTQRACASITTTFAQCSTQTITCR